VITKDVYVDLDLYAVNQKN